MRLPLIEIKCDSLLDILVRSVLKLHHLLTQNFL